MDELENELFEQLNFEDDGYLDESVTTVLIAAMALLGGIQIAVDRKADPITNPGGHIGKKLGKMAARGVAKGVKYTASQINKLSKKAKEVDENEVREKMRNDPEFRKKVNEKMKELKTSISAIKEENNFIVNEMIMSIDEEILNEDVGVYRVLKKASNEIDKSFSAYMKTGKSFEKEIKSAIQNMPEINEVYRCDFHFYDDVIVGANRAMLSIYYIEFDFSEEFLHLRKDRKFLDNFMDRFSWPKTFAQLETGVNKKNKLTLSVQSDMVIKTR